MSYRSYQQSDPIYLDEIAEFLNELLALDPQVILALVNIRVSCNKAINDHPHVQVYGLDDGGACVGLIGILNGLIGKRGRLGFVYDDEDQTKVKSFTVFIPHDSDL